MGLRTKKKSVFDKYIWTITAGTIKVELSEQEGNELLTFISAKKENKTKEKIKSRLDAKI